LTAAEKLRAVDGIIDCWRDGDDEEGGSDGLALRSIVDVLGGCSTCEVRQRLLEAALRRMKEADRLLENDLGGFYLSAPDGDDLGRVRALLRGEAERNG